MIEKIITIEQPAETTYKDKETLEFELILEKNYYTYLKSLHLCFAIRFRKLTTADQNLNPNLVPVNNLFAHWIKEIDITKCGTNKNLITTTTSQEVYRYSNTMLKHLSKNGLKMIQKDLLFSKKVVIYPANSNRRSHNIDDTTKRTDNNIEDREDKSAVQIDSKYMYRMPLKYFSGLGKINFPTKIDLKICCTLETEIEKLFALKKKKKLQP